MASNAMTAAQLANWIPEYQSAKALSALEKRLVIQKAVWTDWRSQLKQGDTLNVPIIPDLGAADSVSLTADLTLNAATTSRKQIVVDQWNYKAVGIGYREQLQNYPDFLSQMTEKCAYSVSKRVDYFLALKFTSLTAGNIGTQGTAIDDDVLLTGVENLNKADADTALRSLILDPASLTDLMKIDKMVADAYVNRGAVESPEGLIGMSRYGCKVYLSNNLEVANSSYHNGAMMQREAIGLIIQQDNLASLVDWPQKHTRYVEVQAIFGGAVLRPTAGCRINTRA